MLKIYTSRVFTYKGPDKLDITVKSGDKVFAPTWDMVMGHKRGKYTDEQYTKMYREMMGASYTRQPKHWKSMFAKDTTVVLCCYCRPGAFCHRHILKDILLEHFDGEYLGEI